MGVRQAAGSLVGRMGIKVIKAGRSPLTAPPPPPPLPLGWRQAIVMCAPFVTRGGPPPNGYHRHRCPNPRCGNLWTHSDGCGGDDKAHTCEKCGAEQWARE